jgi:hypothetical protein
MALPDHCVATYIALSYQTRELVLRTDAEKAVREVRKPLSDRHETIIRAAAKAVASRGHEGDAKLADSLLGVLASLQSGGAS